MSVRIKLIAVLTAILVGSFILLSFFNFNVSRQHAREEALNSALPLTRDNIYSEIQSSLMRPLFVSSLMANDTFLKDWASAGEIEQHKIENYLAEIQLKYGFFSAFFVSAQSGCYYYPEGVLKKVSPDDSHDIWFYKFIESGRDYDLDVDTNEAADNILTIFINHRVTDKSGKLLGVTGVGLKMDKVSKLLKTFSKKYSKTIFLVDPQGLVQAHHEVDLIEHVNIRNFSGIRDVAQQVLITDESGPATFEYELSGEKVYLTARYIPELEWFLIVEQRENDTLKAARDNLMRTIVVGGLSTLLIVFISILTINHFQLRLEKQANTDALTGVANRSFFENRVNEAITSFHRSGKPFSLILLDIDGFKQVNDLCGHIDGDSVLCTISRIILKSIREVDLCARWGGDEFIILVSGNEEAGVVVAEKVRAAVEQVALQDFCTHTMLDELKITVSCGVTQFASGDTLDSATLRADRAMYLCKNSGKNKVYQG